MQNCAPAQGCNTARLCKTAAPGNLKFQNFKSFQDTAQAKLPNYRGPRAVDGRGFLAMLAAAKRSKHIDIPMVFHASVLLQSPCLQFQWELAKPVLPPIELQLQHAFTESRKLTADFTKCCRFIKIYQFCMLMRHRLATTI